MIEGWHYWLDQTDETKQLSEGVEQWSLEIIFC